MSQLCNAFQVIQGFFLELVNAPERLINALSHSGWSISNQSIHNMIKSTTWEQKVKIQELGHSGLFAIVHTTILILVSRPSNLQLKTKGHLSALQQGHSYHSPTVPQKQTLSIPASYGTRAHLIWWEWRIQSQNWCQAFTTSMSVSLMPALWFKAAQNGSSWRS